MQSHVDKSLPLLLIEISYLVIRAYTCESHQCSLRCLDLFSIFLSRSLLLFLACYRTVRCGIKNADTTSSAHVLAVLREARGHCLSLLFELWELTARSRKVALSSAPCEY